MKKKIIILGSTGSVGQNTIDILKKDKKNFEIILLSTQKNINKIFDQKNIFKGKTGVFEIKDKKISHKLNFYKVENGKFIKIF